MARITVDYFSSCLMRTTTLEVILPVDDPGEAMATDARTTRGAAGDVAPIDYPAGTGALRTLFLLHGITGNHGDWVSESRICALAADRRLAVIMPSGYNAFYLDQPESHNYYGEFVGRELVTVARRMFGLPCRREDTFVGGISMGGYGALRCGLRYCETFGGIVAMSAAMVTGDAGSMVSEDGPFFLRRAFLESAFGDLGTVTGSQKDPARLAADLVYCDRPRPRVLMACGGADPFCAADRELAIRLTSTGLDVTWRETTGGHDWDTWNQMLPDALDWVCGA